MGCCASTPSPYPTQQPNSSSRAITSSQPQSQAALPRPSTGISRQSTSNRQPQQPRDLTAHINRPLKLHVWASTARTWNRRDLDRERVEFFETRVTGRSEIWQTIRTALEVLWTGGDAEDVDGGLATAQLILNAAAVTIPTGDLCAGVYDSFGEFYPIPEHIVANPTNLVETPNPPEQEEDKSESDPSDPDEEEILRRREEKGKAVLNLEDQIAVGFKLSDRDGKTLKVTIGKADTVRLVCRKIMEESGISPPKQLKLAYMGKILNPTQSLEAQGFNTDHVLNALVFNRTDS